MKRYAIATAVTLLGVFSWAQTPKADAPTYTVQVLSTSASIANIDNFVPWETGINASGQVSGYVQDANWNTRAVFYTGTAWQYVPGTTWGSTAAGINIHGDIVGSRVVGTVGTNTIMHAFRYNAASGQIDDIPPLTAGRSSYGFGINDNGDVVGQTDVSLNVFRAFVARFGQSPVQLPSLGGSFDSACGINNFGQIAETTGTGGQHAARVEADGTTIVDAGTLSGDVWSAACAIDDFGHIGGSSSANGYATVHAFRWDPGDPVMADAGLSSVYGNVFSIAGGVSVGYYQTATGPMLALMHTDANGAVDLNTLLPANSGWVLTEALGVNASGQIVGDGFFNNNPAVFLMSPAKAKDTTPPVIAAHADVTAEATGPGGASVSYSAPGTTDNVDAPGTAICTPASGGTFTLGTTTVTCKATDAAGNAATPTTFNVIVKDTTPPVIASHADVTAEATGPTGASVTYTPPATTDAVDGTRSATCTPASGWTFPLGTTTVTCKATDAAGNAAVPTTFNVIVKDTTAPVISMLYASPNAIWPPDGKMVPVSVTVTVTDVVDPSPSCSLTSISGGSAGSSTITGQSSANVRSDNGAAYILTVTCRDVSGNASSLSTSVVVTKTNGNGATPKTIKTATSTNGYDADRDDHDRDDHDRHHNRDGRNDRDDRGRDRGGQSGIDR